MDLRRGHFSVKMYAKMKELGPIGGGVRPARPPRSANDRESRNRGKTKILGFPITVKVFVPTIIV